MFDWCYKEESTEYQVCTHARHTLWAGDGIERLDLGLIERGGDAVDRRLVPRDERGRVPSDAHGHHQHDLLALLLGVHLEDAWHGTRRTPL